MRLHVWLAVGTEELQTKAEVVDVSDNPWKGGVASFALGPIVREWVKHPFRHLHVTIEPVPER